MLCMMNPSSVFSLLVIFNSNSGYFSYGPRNNILLSNPQHVFYS